MVMQKCVIDCATGEQTFVALTPDEQAAYDAQQTTEAAVRSAAQAALNAADAQRTADATTLHDALTGMGLPDAAAALLRILTPQAP